MSIRDMAIVEEALLEVKGAHRINYAIMGNSDPVLHAHIDPRYPREPEAYRHGLPWPYPQWLIDARAFDFEGDQFLMQKLTGEIPNVTLRGF